MSAERLIPTSAIAERFGLDLQPKKSIVKHRVHINIRKIRHVDESGVHTLYLNASDVLTLLDREYEVTEHPTVGQLAKVVRQITGRA